MPGFEKAGEKEKKPPLHVAIAKYLKEIEALKKLNRKYEAVLKCFREFFRNHGTSDSISLRRPDAVRGSAEKGPWPVR